MHNKPYYCAVFKIDEKIYILCDDDGAILVEETRQKMDHHFSDKYEAKHRLSYEGSMSACFHWVMGQPRIQKAPLNLDEMKELDIVEDESDIPIFNIGNPFFIKGILLDGKNAKDWYSAGDLVTLIN